ncbi:MAG: hypothetical protein U9O66_01350 [Patescibacteria group bacterium]|nr:hypothetical protein [Patescibacteria group bacterium]
MFEKKLNSFSFALTIFALLEILVSWPKFIWIISFLAFVFIFFFVWKILPKNISTRQGLRNSRSLIFKITKIAKIFVEEKNYFFLASPIFLLCGAILFLMFLENDILMHLSILLFSFIFFLFSESLFANFYDYQSQSYPLENVLTGINLLALFLIYSHIFLFLALFHFSLWIMLPFLILTTFVSTFQLFYIYKIARKINYFYSIIATIIILEIFWSIMFLPTNFYVNGLILINVYYIIIGMSYFYFTEVLAKARVVRHLLISLIIIILTLATAKWA